MMIPTMLLQAATSGGSGMQSLLMILLIFVVFYFFMIRPQTKKAKAERTFREAIKKGDKVVTIGGLHGKVVEIEERTILIEVDGNIKLRFEKSSISAEATKSVQEGK